jgi:ABC-type nitrate/sulfonate/bicarbonate transport system substrate-binding protein
MCYRRLLIIKILEILIVLLGSGGMTCSAVAGEAQPVGIGLTREASAAPLFIAVEEGYFVAEGLEPYLTFFNDDFSVSAGGIGKSRHRFCCLIILVFHLCCHS